MTSALGDYIHYWKRNYMKYGVGESSVGEIQKFSYSKQQFLNERFAGHKTVSPNTIQRMKNILAANTYSQESKDASLQEFQRQEQLNFIYEILAKHTTENLIGRVQGNAFNQGKGSGWAYDEEVLGWIRGKYNGIKNQNIKTLKKSTLEKKKAQLTLLNKKINDINNIGFASEEDFQQISNYYFEITGEPIGQEMLNQSMLGKIQDMANAYGLYTDISNLVGAFGERLLAMCADNVDKMSKEELAKFFKEAVIGTQSSSFQVSQNQVRGDLTSIMGMSETGTTYKATPTQNKVDVQIKVNREDVFANVKHYYGAKEVSLQDSTSLLYSLIYLENLEKMGSHWLNIHTVIPGHRAMIQSPTQQINDIMKMEIAYEALVSGNPLKNSAKANVFAYLDRKTGRTIIKDTKDIIEQDFNRFIFTPDLDTIRFSNEWGGEENIRSQAGANARINRILAEVRNFKIKTAFKVSKTIK